MTRISRRPAARVAAAFGIIAAQSLAMGALAAGPAHASVQYYEIRSPDGKCLAVPGSSQYSGADVVLWDCLGITDQRWRVTDGLDTPVGQLEDRPASQQTDHILFVKLRAQHSDKCLVLTGDRFELGGDIVQADCSDQNLNTEWGLEGHGDRFEIGDVHCVGVAGGRHRNGTPVVYQARTEKCPKWLFKPWQ
ncbi:MULTISPECIES: RICIN domain-containing protein [unclassified Streptomyces]|uniref:RICIN domain-containing protein n=1 Tax=unclassified Streptomyces TaxID=2593676 RepID=UPI002E35FA03|nr:MULTISPECIES: RICIN domain-containing protein [unclassified Streptomyces]WUC68475.1 RICIN domain-containing protein [Streptomyces sp. NBC_00539]